MRTLEEGNLHLQVPQKMQPKKFDDASTHGLSHCMKAVDFIIETESHFLFIEFKDPDNPLSHENNRKEFLEKFKSGKIDADLSQKYRDSWIYQYSSGNLNSKPVKYLILIACESLSTAELSARTDGVRRKLPLKDAKGQAWNRFAQDCLIFNISTWNKIFPTLPITRFHTGE